ncbi:MAG: lanthionine synthetase LanC family protein [Rothia sp. (in: high G+C Gram-positive bacteria)]|nr:lanthionine synthetase LanC family protein [Rothia sp. (in: high G+C Gram-positive bacteria)]
MFPIHWCHGAAGIYLARALSQSSLQSSYVSELIDQSKSALLDSPLPRNDSLCHSSLGNAICLYSAGDRKAGRQYLDESVRRILASNFRHGLGLPVKTVPGLMLGYAGFIHAICVAINESIPSVLSFESIQKKNFLT